MPADEIEIRPYRRGDAALIPVDEADPFGFWLTEIEANAKGMTSYFLDDLLIAVSYYMPLWDGVAEAGSLINRELAAGHGKKLARAFRRRADDLMQANGLHRAQCTSEAHDRASQVFLRAIGYRYESTMRQGAPDRRDLLVYVLLKGDAHEQENPQDGR